MNDNVFAKQAAAGDRQEDCPPKRVVTSRRILFRRAAAVISSTGAVSLAACSFGARDPSAGSGRVIDAATIRVMTPPRLPNDATVPVYDAANDRFMATTPLVKVEDEPTPDWPTKLPALVAAGSPPDVVRWVDDQKVPQYGVTGVAQPLNDLVKRDKYDLNAFAKQTISANTYQEKLYGLPWYWDMRILFTNRQLFREAGLNPDTPPKTLGDLDVMADKLTRRDDGALSRVGFLPMVVPGSAFGGNTYLFLWGWANGGEFTNKELTKITLDTPSIVEALEWARRWVDRLGGHDAVRAFSNRVAPRGPSSNTSSQDAVAGQHVGMWIQTHVWLDRFVRPLPAGKDLDIGTAPPPAWKVPVTWSGVLATVLPQGSPHRDHAWLFMKYMASPENQRLFGEQASFVPTRPAVAGEASFQKDPVRKTAASVIPITRVRPPLPVSLLLWNELVKASDEVLGGTANPRDVLRRAQETVQQELNRYLK